MSNLLPRYRLELRGYSVERGRFLLSALRVGADGTTESASPPLPRVLERALVDLQSWDRLLHRTASDLRQRLPTRRLRKLMASNWVRGDVTAGWRVEYKKTVAACEVWLSAAFARLPKPQQLEFLDDGLYAAATHKRAAARAESKHARDLQQYFTSLPLVDDVLHRVTELLKLREQKEMVWLEPSCGDGRFLTALLRAGAKHVVGYEIDARVQVVAAERVREALVTKDSDKVRAEVCLGDFLTSKRSTTVDQFVVAIGNPPFGAKGGDGRDLVHSFFRHAAHEWQACVIAFIVPERCSRPSFVETTLLQLNGDNHGNWALGLEQSLADFQFEFGAGETLKHVRQPSALQVFSRVNGN